MCLVGPTMQLPTLQPLMLKLITVVTGSCEAAQSIGRDFITKPIQARTQEQVFTFIFFYFEAELVTQWNLEPTFSANYTAYCSVLDDKSLTQQANSSFKPKMNQNLASSLDTSTQQFNRCKEALIYPVTYPEYLHGS